MSFSNIGALLSNLKPLLTFFAPLLLTKGWVYYRNLQNAPRKPKPPVQPIPAGVLSAILVLAGFAAIFLLRALPPFAPENLFTLTQSRLQIPSDTLFNRVSALRPSHVLTPADHALRAKFVNLESKLLYLQYGPEPLAECLFCSSDEPNTYLWYALPSMLWPHVLNMVVIATATSSRWTGQYGPQWRSYATIAAGVVAVLDIIMVSSYKHQGNARATRLTEVDFFHWTMRVYRLVILSMLDVALAALLYVSSTNRFFVRSISTAERLEAANRSLFFAKSKMGALGIIKNTALRDEELRSRVEDYWKHEVNLMRDIMEDREVVDGVNDALSSRINIQSITRDADAYTQSILQPLQATNTT